MYLYTSIGGAQIQDQACCCLTACDTTDAQPTKLRPIGSHFACKYLVLIKLAILRWVFCRFSKQAFLQDVPNPHDLPDGTISFMDFMGSRNNRFTTPEAAQKNHILERITLAKIKPKGMYKLFGKAKLI